MSISDEVHALSKIYSSQYASPHHITFTLAQLTNLVTAAAPRLIPPLEWSEEKEATEEIRYNHVVAQTPFGRFLITWKGWKEGNSPTIDETPWGDFGGVGHDLADAKRQAEAEYQRRLRAVFTAGAIPLI